MRPLTLGLVLLATSVSVAAASRQTRPSLRITPNPVKAGHMVAIMGSADDCPAGDTVTVISHAFSARHSFAGVPAVLTRVKAGGAFRASTRIPAGKHAGVYGVTARCGGGNLGVLVRLRVRH